MMILPVPTSDLLQWIPHRPPMVWVDEVTVVESFGGKALIHLKAEALYMSADGLRASSFIEFLAQAFGFIGVCRQALHPRADGASVLKKAFLVAIRDAEIFVEPSHPALKPGQTLVVEMSGKKDIGPIQITDGRITSLDGTLLAKGHLKVYAEYAEN